jgi:hypothetical protein
MADISVRFFQAQLRGCLDTSERLPGRLRKPVNLQTLWLSNDLRRRTSSPSGCVFTRSAQTLARNFVKSFTNLKRLMPVISGDDANW